MNYTSQKGAKSKDIKGFFQLTDKTVLRMALPGDFVRRDACAAIDKVLPGKPFLLEIAGTLITDSLFPLGEQRTFYLSFTSDQDRREMSDALRTVIQRIKLQTPSLDGRSASTSSPSRSKVASQEFVARVMGPFESAMIAIAEVKKLEETMNAQAAFSKISSVALLQEPIYGSVDEPVNEILNEYASCSSITRDAVDDLDNVSSVQALTEVDIYALYSKPIRKSLRKSANFALPSLLESSHINDVADNEIYVNAMVFTPAPESIYGEPTATKTTDAVYGPGTDFSMQVPVKVR